MQEVALDEPDVRGRRWFRQRHIERGDLEGGGAEPARYLAAAAADLEDMLPTAQHVTQEADSLTDRELVRIHPPIVARQRCAILPGVLRLRPATLDDLSEVLPRTLALNAHEGIAVDPAALEAALVRLLGDPGIGGVWLVERDGAPIGYAIATFGYDLEFAGRDAFLTEIWIDPA